MGDAAGLIENFLGVFRSVGGVRIGLDHLRVAGNRGQSVLKFMRDAGGKFAKGGEIFAELHLLLQRRQFSEIAEQADGAGGSFLAAADRGDGDAELAMAAVGRDVLSLFTAKNLSFREALLNQSGQRACFARRFAEAAKYQAFNAQRLFGSGIGAGDQAIGADHNQACGHIARDFFTEASGIFGAFTFCFVKALQLFFLFAKFQNDRLHGGGHKCRHVFRARNRIVFGNFVATGLAEGAPQ